MMGARRAGSGKPKEFFDGVIDEVRVSKTARYSQDFTPANRCESDKDTIALYHCDEGIGNTLFDSSGNKHHGKIAGAKWVNANATPPEPSPYSQRFALWFGADGRVELPQLPMSAFEPYTVEAWIQADVLSADHNADIVRINEFAGLRTNLKGAWMFNALNRTSSVEPRPGFVHFAGVCTGQATLVFLGGNSISINRLPFDAKATDPSLAGNRIVIGKGWHGRIREVRISRIARYDKSFTPAQRFEPDKDTLALYHFDEGSGDVLKDSSSNGHHGKIVGAKWVKADGSAISVRPPTPALIRYALRFDDPATGVQIPTLKIDLRCDFTLEAYATPETMGVPGKPFVAGVRGQATLKIGRWDTATEGWLLGTAHQDKKVYGIGPAPVEVKRRTHLAAVRKGNRLQLWVDGKLRAEQETASPLVEVLNSFMLGDGFHGVIDEVRVSSRARYDKEFTPAKRFEPDPYTIALYHCDEGSGDVLKDSSSNGHHGKIIGARWVKAEGTPIAALAPEESAAKKLQEETAAKLTLPVEKENKIGMKLRLIPPGPGVANAFYLGKYEVTQGEWEQVMGYNPSNFHRKNSKMAGLETSKFPVETMSWFDSVEFCNKLSEREGLKPYYALAVTKRQTDGKRIDEAEVKILGGSGYRIPKDAEWEHGCRAGTKTKYHCGDKDDDLLEYAWFIKNSEGRTHEVGAKKPNAFGLYDMHGNVFEFNEEMLLNAKGVLEIISRGGSHNNPAGSCAVAARYHGLLANRHHSIGLRVARAAGASGSASVPAQADYALYFYSAQLIEIPQLKLPDKDPYTMESYFRPSKGNANTGALGVRDQSNLRFNNQGWRWEVSDAGKAKGKVTIFGAPRGPNCDHVAAVHDGKEIRLYVNGKLYNRRPLTESISGKLPFCIGDNYQGLADEVRVSKVARCTADFTPAKRFEPASNTLALYHCDEGTGNRFIDSSGNNMHGAISGATWVNADGSPIAR
jgi:hypothetical protein